MQWHVERVKQEVADTQLWPFVPGSRKAAGKSGKRDLIRQVKGENINTQSPERYIARTWLAMEMQFYSNF